MRLYDINTVKKLIYKKNMLARAVSRLGIALPQPINILVYITLNCGNDCEGCFQKTDEFYRNRLSSMASDDYRFILASLKKAYPLKPNIHLFGGEPLLHPQFSEFLSISRELGYRPSITINMRYIDEKNIDLLGSSSISQLNISINSYAGGEIRDIYGKLIGHVRRLKERYNKAVSVVYYLSPSNHRSFSEVVMHLSDNLDKNTISTFLCQHFLFDNRAEAIEKNKGMDIECVKEQTRALRRRRLNFNLMFLPNLPMDMFERYYKSEETFMSECYIPWLGLAVYPDLNVTMGGGMLWCNNIVGSLRDKTWSQIWHGDKLKYYRNMLMHGRLPEECFRCCHKVYC